MVDESIEIIYDKNYTADGNNKLVLTKTLYHPQLKFLTTKNKSIYNKYIERDYIMNIFNEEYLEVYNYISKENSQHLKSPIVYES